MGNSFSFDNIIDRKNTGSIKWDIYASSDTIPMWVADMDFKSPDAVIEALHKRVNHGVFGYTWQQQSFTDAVVNWVSYRHNWNISPDWIVTLPGLVTALNITCRAFTKPDEEVITFTPVYPPFLDAPINMNQTLVKCPLTRHNNKFTFDLDLFESMITDKTKVLLLCTPHNPVGRVWTKQELTAITEICLRKNIVICSDEIHCDLILDDNKHIPTATLNDETASNTITLMAPSKTFNIPGLGCSFAIIPNAELRDTFKNASKGIVPYMNLFGYDACQAAFDNSRNWHTELLKYLSENAKLAHNAINSIDGLWTDSVQATYLSWINIEALKLDAPAKYFESHGVGLSDGAEFADAGFLRLNFGCPRPMLTEGLDRIKNAVEKL